MKTVRHLKGILRQNSVTFGENFREIQQTAEISAQQRCHAARVFVTLPTTALESSGGVRQIRSLEKGKRNTGTPSTNWGALLYCTFYTVHCILYTVHWTLYNLHCILYNFPTQLFQTIFDLFFHKFFHTIFPTIFITQFVNVVCSQKFSTTFFSPIFQPICPQNSL